LEIRSFIVHDVNHLEKSHPSSSEVTVCSVLMISLVTLLACEIQGEMWMWRVIGEIGNRSAGQYKVFEPSGASLICQVKIMIATAFVEHTQRGHRWLHEKARVSSSTRENPLSRSRFGHTSKPSQSRRQTRKPSRMIMPSGSASHGQRDKGRRVPNPANQTGGGPCHRVRFHECM
jgi:hypothetical protein